jgi:hypothetical protein
VRFQPLVFLVLFVTALPLSPVSADNPPVVGTIAGTFDVTLSGSASYSIPIRVAPGTAGTEPKIAIVYDSQSVGGPLGAGWSIAGLSTITRGPKSLFFDGMVAGVRVDDSDALYLDGQRLVEISRTGAGSGRRIEYRKDVDDVSRIVQTGAELASSTFVVQTKGGVTLLFDGSHNSRVRFTDGSVFLLALSRTIDTAGSYIEYRYRSSANGDYDIQSIRYTGHLTRDGSGAVISDRRPYASLEFDYETTGRAIDVYVAGRLSRRNTRLKAIVARVAAQPDDATSVQWTDVGRYVFEYEDRGTLNRFVLTRLRQFGEDGSELTPTTFTYSTPDVGWKEAPFQLPLGVLLATRELLGAGYRFAHFSDAGGGRPDLLFAALIGGKLESLAFRNDGGTWTRLDDFKPPVPFIGEHSTDLGAIVADINGDGRADVLTSHQRLGQAPEHHAFLAAANGWQATDEYKLPFNVAENGKVTAVYRFVRLSGGPGPDMIYDTGAARGFLANTGKGWKPDPQHAPPVPLDARTRFLDVDCDGKAELVAAFTDASQNMSWKVYRFTSTGWSEITSAAFAPPFPAATAPEAVREIDLDKDGCTDVIVSTDSASVTPLAFTASPTGWRAAPGKTPPFALVDRHGNASGAIAVDLDQDGRLDIIANRALPDGSSLRFAYRQTADGWERLGDGFVPPVLWPSDAKIPPADVFVVDIDGDGRPDIAMPSGARQGFGHIYAGTAAGFEEKPQYAPPVAIARRDLQDRGVRLVDLNGDGLSDVIFRRDIVKDGKNETIAGAFLNTGKGWRTVPGLSPPLPLASDTITGNPVQLVDVDGDGYIDFLYSYRRADGSVTRAYFRNEPDGPDGRKWTEQKGSGLIPPQQFPFAAENVGDLGVRLVDLNGDGRIDMIVGSLPPRTFPPMPVEICTNQPTGPPKCTLNRGLFAVAAFLNDGSSWVGSLGFAPPLPFVAQAASPRPSTESLFVELVDVDGDRLPDLIARFKHPHDPGIEVSEVWLNTGSGWALAGEMPAPIPLDSARRDPRALIQLIDVNGDGLADIVFSKRDGPTNASATWLSTGKGFVQSSAWQVPIQAIANRGGDQGFRFVDVNGDGLVDVVYSRKIAGGAVERGLRTNTGAGWTTADPKVVTTIPAFIDEHGADQGVRLFDVDGNGLLDVIRSFAGGDSGEATDQLVLLNSGRRADVLVAIDRGYQSKMLVSYQTLLETSPDPGDGGGLTGLPWLRVYEPGVPGTYPIVSPVPATYVVRQVVFDDGHERRTALSYRYGDFRMHAQAMRSLGFGWRESYNEFNSVLARTELSQDVRVGSRQRRDAICWLRMDRRGAQDDVP